MQIDYEKIYTDFYSKNYDRFEESIKRYWMKQKTDRRSFGFAFNEVNKHIATNFKDKYNFSAYCHLEDLYNLFQSRYSFFDYDYATQGILETEIKKGFDLLNVSQLPAYYDYSKFIKDIALLDVEREISRLLSNNSQYLALFYDLNDFSEFEIRHHKGLMIEDYPIFKTLRRRLPITHAHYLETTQQPQPTATDNENEYLGQSTNENANNLFDYLIKFYRPAEQTIVKYVNILHFLKNDAEKKHFIFTVKQDAYKTLVKEKTGIEIKKFAKSEQYNEIEKPIFHALEDTFIKKKMV